MCKKMTDFAFPKWGGIRDEACCVLVGDWQFQRAEPKAIEPIPVPSDCKKCRLVANTASFSIASLTKLFIGPESGYWRINRSFKYRTLHDI
jgi:hypothetical protein